MKLRKRALQTWFAARVRIFGGILQEQEKRRQI